MSPQTVDVFGEHIVVCDGDGGVGVLHPVPDAGAGEQVRQGVRVRAGRHRTLLVRNRGRQNHS